mgnify:CR=1 FL=1
MGLARKFFTVSGLTVISRVFGVMRESILVHFLGASIEMDAFTTAFKFPGFFRRFFAEGGFQSIFVPYFTDFTSAKKLKGAGYFSSRIFSLIFWIMLVVTILVLIFAKEFTILMAPGFAKIPEKLALATEFTRIIFPSVAFVSLSTVYSGILVSRQKFFPFAMAPILVNLVLVSSLFICQDLLSAGRRISYGVLAAGIFQFIYMYLCVRIKKLPTPKLSSIKISNRVRAFLKKLAPVLAGAGVAQVNILVGSFFASFLPTGCITYLYCADRFVQFPLALFGISMGIVLLPEIAEGLSKKRKTDLKGIQNRSLLFTLRLTLPSVMGLISLSYWMISLLYGHGKFDQAAVQNTADVLKVAAIGLPSFVIAKIMSSVLFAQKDAKTPVTAAIVSIIANIIFSIILIKPFHELGIAISSSLAGFINVYVMCRKSKGWFKFEKSVIIDFTKILIASFIMLGVILLIDSKIDIDGSKLQELFLVISTCLIGTIVYLVSLFFLKDQALKSCISKVRMKFLKR